MWDLIVSVPVHRLSFYLTIVSEKNIVFPKQKHKGPNLTLP